jgi:hypothetical protein
MGEDALFSPLNLTAEDRLVIACVEPPERVSEDSIRQAAEGVTDPERFAEKALQGKFAPLVLQRLADASATGFLPKPALRRLGAAQAVSQMTNLRLLAERDRILDAMKEESLQALPLKGCALADALYGDPSLRPMGDLDLLIPPDSMERTAVLLSKLGYRTDGIDPRGETFFYRESDQTFIDAHASLDPSGRFAISVSDLWAEAAPLKRRGASTPAGPADSSSTREWRTLSPRHHLMHALLHAARHRLESLAPLVDAVWIAERWKETLGWEEIPAFARRWRCREALGFAMEAAYRTFSLAAPEKALRETAPSGLRRMVLARFWPGDDPLQPIESRSKAGRYLFSAFTTSWPSGFFGSLVRYKKIRPL